MKLHFVRVFRITDKSMTFEKYKLFICKTYKTQEINKFLTCQNGQSRAKKLFENLKKVTPASCRLSWRLPAATFQAQIQSIFN